MRESENKYQEPALKRLLKNDIGISGIPIDDGHCLFDMDHFKDQLEILDDGAVCRLDPVELPMGMRLGSESQPFKLSVLTRSPLDFPNFLYPRLPSSLRNYIGDSLRSHGFISHWVYISGIFKANNHLANPAEAELIVWAIRYSNLRLNGFKLDIKSYTYFLNILQGPIIEWKVNNSMPVTAKEYLLSRFQEQKKEGL